MNDKNRIRLLLSIAMLLAAATVSCPEASAQVMGRVSGVDTEYKANPFESDNEEGEEGLGTPTKADTTRKYRKPLESYFFDDSTRKDMFFKWNVDTYFNRVHMQQIDTTLTHFQLDYPHYREDVGDAYLGNLGAATIPLNYFRRPDYQDFEMSQTMYAYFFTTENVPFYNVKRAFTNFAYYWAGQKRQQEETLNLVHAQNISPSSGFNLSYNRRGTKGSYSWQKTKNKNLSMVFSHTGKRYSIHTGFIYNHASLRENGGLRFDRDLTDTVYEQASGMQMRLSDAKNSIRNTRLFAIQSYGIPLTKITDEDFSIGNRSTIFVGHIIDYSTMYRRYTDTRAKSVWYEYDAEGNVVGDQIEYYDKWYINNSATRDSVSESKLTNRLFVQLQPWDRNSALGVLDAGIGMDRNSYYMFDLNDFVTGNSSKKTETSYYVYGALDGMIKRYAKWRADLTFHPAGSNKKDLSIGGELSLSAFLKDKPITLDAKIRMSRSSPSYWQNKYFSNHFVWNNDFSQQQETRIGATLTVPHTRTILGVNHAMISDKIYYGDDCMPAQYGGNINVTGIYLQQDFVLGSFNMHHRLLYQNSDTENVIPVPKLSAYISYYFNFYLVRNVLQLQTGFDARYATKYYGFAYNPALAQFHTQSEKKIAGYPLVDVFLTAKWKRVRIDLKLQHLNEDMIAREYFTVLHYPLNKRIMKLGISWQFYD